LLLDDHISTATGYEVVNIMCPFQCSSFTGNVIRCEKACEDSLTNSRFSSASNIEH